MMFIIQKETHNNIQEFCYDSYDLSRPHPSSRRWRGRDYVDVAARLGNLAHEHDNKNGLN